MASAPFPFRPFFQASDAFRREFEGLHWISISISSYNIGNMQSVTDETTYMRSLGLRLGRRSGQGRVCIGGISHGFL